MIETNGDTWREHRRFVIHQLREFGLGKNMMEQRVSSLTRGINMRIN